MKPFVLKRRWLAETKTLLQSSLLKNFFYFYTVSASSKSYSRAAAYGKTKAISPSACLLSKQLIKKQVFFVSLLLQQQGQVIRPTVPKLHRTKSPVLKRRQFKATASSNRRTTVTHSAHTRRSSFRVSCSCQPRKLKNLQIRCQSALVPSSLGSL